MSKCELCLIGESVGLFWVKDSHMIEDRVTKMRLCALCIFDLRNAGVRLKVVEEIKT